MTSSPLIERLERVERLIATGNDSWEAPNGKIMVRVWITDLAAVVDLAREALRAKATSND